MLYREEFDQPGLGFAFLIEFQRQGFAKESSKAILHHFAEVKNILAFTHPENNGSMFLFESLSFVFISTIEVVDKKKEQSSSFFELAR